MTADVHIPERRKARRKKALNAGSVKFGFGPGIECTLRNISAGGACLVFVLRRTALPKEFALTVEPGGVRRSCRLVWQSSYRVGVRFVKPA
jgi:hypothetical protein